MKKDDASLLRALASDVAQDPSYAFGKVTARELRRIAGELEAQADFEAESVVREVARRLDKSAILTTDISFVAAGNADEVTTIKVSPRVAAKLMSLLETLAGAQNVAPRVA